MTRRIFFKLIATVVSLLALAGFGAQYLVSNAIAENLRSELQRSLGDKARLTQRVFADVSSDEYASVVDDLSARSEARVTVIDRSGNVLAESDADASEMENHAERPEFIEALAGREGVSSRFSNTVGEEMLYFALPMQDGAVRLALPLSEINVRVSAARRQILIGLALALAPTLILALWMARRVSWRMSSIIGYSRRLAEGDFQAKLPEISSGELGELAETLGTTAGQLRSMFEQLQEERSRFAAAVNGIGEGILVADRKLRVVLFNPAMEQMLPGAPVFKGASLKDWHDEEVPQLFSQVLESGEPLSVDVELDETQRSWKISCAPILSRKGKVQAVVAVFYDITELERVDRMRKDFVINVSHELRTPLAAIQGYAETLLDGAIDEPGTNRRFMKILWQNAERLAQLTADLMTLSQIEVNTREFSFTPHSVTELLDDAVSSIVMITDKKKISIEVEPPAEDVVIECDSGAIHQVLNNLLDNAAKYTPEGGKLWTGARAVEGGQVEFFVRDTGIGIAAEHIPRLFERFYRIDKARSRELGGTGLGLAICKHLVLSHHGSVRVESEPGVGSTFFFTLPVHAPAEPVNLDMRQQALF